MSHSEIVKALFLVTLAGGTVFFMYFLRKHSIDQKTTFNVSDYLLGEMVAYVALGATTWALIYVVLNRPDLIAALFSTYGTFWIVPTVTALIVNGVRDLFSRAPPPPEPKDATNPTRTD